MMKYVIAGDIIIHLIEGPDGANSLIGYSTAAADVDTDNTHYEVPITNFTKFAKPIRKDSFTSRHKTAILKIVRDKPHYQPFQLKSDDSGFRVPEGYYFGPAMPALTKQLPGPIASQLPVQRPNKSRHQNKQGSGKGPSHGGVRSSALWEARHSPLVNKIVGYIEMLGFRQRDSLGWSPDILMNNCDKTVLIEVKPNTTKHNIITAIGQIVCYGSPFNDITCIVAAKGSKCEDSLARVMKQHSIQYLNLTANWQGALRKLLQE